MGPPPRHSASHVAKGPSKLVLSSESSSSNDVTPKHASSEGQLAKKARAAAGEGRPSPHASQDMKPVAFQTPGKHSDIPKVPPKKAPPPPSVDVLGSLYVPVSQKSDPKRAAPDPALGSEDPLLAVDSSIPPVQRVKSAVAVRSASVKREKERQAKSTSMELGKDMFQPLNRMASKNAPKPGEQPVSGKPVESIPLTTQGRVALPEAAVTAGTPRGRERIKASPSRRHAQESSRTKTPSARQDAGGFKEATATALQESRAEDAWGPSRQRGVSDKPRDTGGGRASPHHTQMGAAEKRAPATGASASKNLMTFSKQQPRLPRGRSGQEPGVHTNPWPDTVSESPRKHKASPNMPQNLPSVGSDSAQSPRPKTAVDQATTQGLEGRLEKLVRRIRELEAQAQEANRKHKEELERMEQELRSSLAREINQDRLEHEAALSRARKEERDKMEEFKKEALARQNSMKMRCDASVRELQGKIDHLEKELKAKTADFEKERSVLMKSFEAKQKKNLQVHETQAQTHQKELKDKQSELLEQQGRVQALTASMQTLTTSLAQMKELNDISRTATQALEEKAKTQAAFINTLLKREENMRIQAAKLMPIKEAKRLAFRALLKGRAVEMISRACMPTDASLWNKAWAFQQLVYLIGGSRGSREQRQDAIESRLMQFRKEQMFLMAENERLMAKVAELQQEGVNQRQSKAALVEQALIGDNTVAMSRSSTQSYNKGGPHQELGIRWLLLSVQQILNKKVLWAFLRLHKVTTEVESNTTIDKLQKKFNELRVSAYKEMAARIGVYRLAAFTNGFFSLAKNAGRRAKHEILKQFDHFGASQDPFTQEFRVPEVSFPDAYTPVPDHGRMDLNKPLAHQPHYYRQLPSVRNPVGGRSAFVPMAERRPPIQGYAPHPGFSNSRFTLGVPPVVSCGRRVTTNAGVPNVFPSGPYDATQRVDERGALFRMRGAQQDLRKIMMEDGVDNTGARIVGKKLRNTSFGS
ncbi:hypothetical protein cyc_07028 [Cyclospora cayetanensis]|uniref:Tola protein n=1 Tax=Cyclospora cayetanensis TaxID=88456 RepID=A0A1D3DAA4_9EIME|nr:hypothetical protein cyc_07028 [Cyclospora cayetanensis]